MTQPYRYANSTSLPFVVDHAGRATILRSHCVNNESTGLWASTQTTADGTPHTLWHEINSGMSSNTFTIHHLASN